MGANSETVLYYNYWTSIQAKTIFGINLLKNLLNLFDCEFNFKHCIWDNNNKLVAKSSVNSSVFLLEADIFPSLVIRERKGFKKFQKCF